MCFQAVTASAGVLGSCAALWLHTDDVLGGAAAWILPFTAGGFINIALAQILPELMEETDPRYNNHRNILLSCVLEFPFGKPQVFE